jgi:1,4-dihydroxy-2-naphthoate octaprenyltransferase
MKREVFEMASDSKIHNWIMAARLRTLPAAIAPVIVGSALAFHDGGFRLLPALAALFGAIFIQIGANFANDFMDFQKGADGGERFGPTRVTTAGLISERAMQLGTVLVFGLASLCGVYLIFASGWPVIVIGVLSILVALAYTGGPFPLGYHGLGEVFVLIFFGLAAVGGTYYVQALSYGLDVFGVSLAVGSLGMAILVVNNLRDVKADRMAGKRTTAVRFGVAWTRSEYRLMLAAAYTIPLIMAISGLLPVWVLLTLLCLPMAFNLSRHIGADTGSLLNLSLAATGALELVFCLLLATGLVLSKFY